MDQSVITHESINLRDTRDERERITILFPIGSTAGRYASR
jgi:hypothetical protein